MLVLGQAVTPEGNGWKIKEGPICDECTQPLSFGAEAECVGQGVAKLPFVRIRNRFDMVSKVITEFKLSR